MKISIFILLLSTLFANGQVFTQSSVNGSITIIPKGLQGKSNPLTDSTNVALALLPGESLRRVSQTLL